MMRIKQRGPRRRGLQACLTIALLALASIQTAAIAGGAMSPATLEGDGPVALANGEPGDCRPLDIGLVIDRSGSMTGSALANAKSASIWYVNQLGPSDQSGLVSFASSATHDKHMDFNHAGVSPGTTEYAITALAAGGGTNIASGISASHADFTAHQRPWARQVMILLSDGGSYFPAAQAAANAAKAAGIEIHAIGVGAYVDTALLQEVASDPDSTYYHAAPTENDIRAAFEAIGAATFCGCSGGSNDTSGYLSFVGLGEGNAALGAWSAITGGFGNTAGGTYGAIPGGRCNEVTKLAPAGHVGGGENNTVNAPHGTIGGGELNGVHGAWGTVGGGEVNLANGTHASVGGGRNNTASGEAATIAGGGSNAASGTHAASGGGLANSVAGPYSTVTGGLHGNARLYGQEAHASGAFAQLGDAQRGFYTLRQVTLGAAPTELFLDGAGARVTLPEGASWTFEILVVASNLAGDTAGWELRGVIERKAGTTQMVGLPIAVPLSLGADPLALPWVVTAMADDASDALILVAVGDVTSNPIRWVASLETVELIFNPARCGPGIDAVGLDPCPPPCDPRVQECIELDCTVSPRLCISTPCDPGLASCVDQPCRSACIQWPRPPTDGIGSELISQWPTVNWDLQPGG